MVFLIKFIFEIQVLFDEIRLNNLRGAIDSNIDIFRYNILVNVTTRVSCSDNNNANSLELPPHNLIMDR